MADFDPDDLISPARACEIASSWGSLIHNGDPGAVFYTFAPNDATPQGERHRAALLAYTDDCIATATSNPNYPDAERPALLKELEELKAFFTHYPHSGEEFRETYLAESEAILSAASAFARAYCKAATFFDVEHPDGHPDKDSDKRTDVEPEWIVPASLREMIAEADQWATDNAELLTQAYARPGYGGGEWSAEEQAGHDLWLTRNGHGAGFWDRDALEEGGLGDKLSAAAKELGESYLYTGDDGGIYEG